MKHGLPIILVCLLAACASQDEQVTQDTEQAVRDFIDVRQLTETDTVRTASTDRWDKIDQNFIIYETRSRSYLVEFARRCYELDEVPVVADVRHGNEISARFDTIRGCRIARIFSLTEGELAELQAIGESPGSRN